MSAVRGLLRSRQGGGKGGNSADRSMDEANRERHVKDVFEAARGIVKKASSTQAELQAALKLLTEAVHASPANANFYFHRALCYNRLGDYKLALFDFTLAIQIEDYPDPNVDKTDADKKRIAQYYGARGECFRQMGKLEDSIADFRRAKHLEKDNGTWYFEIGVSLYDLGDKHRAITMFNTALEGNVDGPSSSTGGGGGAATSASIGPGRSGGPAATSGGGASKAGGTTVSSAAAAPQGRVLKLAAVRTKALIYRGNTRRELGQAKEAIADLARAVELDDSASNHNLLGLAHFADGDYTSAAQSFQRATDLDSSSAMYFNNLGLANFQRMKYEESLANFREACNRDPDNASIYFNRGNSELALGHFPNALEDFNAALARAPDDENVYHSRGIVFQELKQVPAAIEQFTRALEINPHYRPSLFHLALMYHVNGGADLFRSMDCFSKVLEIDRNDRRAYEGIGLVYCDLLYYDLAVGAFSKALELDAQCNVNYFYRGKALLWLGRYEEAIADFNQALELKCTEPQVYNCRALALKYTGQFPQAIADLTHAISVDPDEVEYWYNRALCYLDVKENTRACDDLTRAINANPEETSVQARLYYLRGKARYQLKEYDATIDDLRKSLNKEPNAADAHDCHYCCGIALANLGQHADAIICFSNAVTLRPNTAAYIHERAKSLQHEGRYQEAVVDFSKVIALQPLNAHAYFRRGFALKSLKQFMEAAEDFEMAKKLQPNNPNLVVNYKTVYDVEFVELCAAGDEPTFAEAAVVASHGSAPGSPTRPGSQRGGAPSRVASRSRY